jgi:23S rRNA (cytidine1920-2'-O)/16S rRNA (cytidine1409-2'-O)-methyltransferase
VPARLDVELVRRGLARSREQAAALIAEGAVLVDGRAASKPATKVAEQADVVVRTKVPAYVSRGAHKLAGALAAFDVSVDNKRCLDAGASTGGFTDVLLRAGAAEVVGVEVGHGQLVDSIRADPRVKTFERTNVRQITPDTIGGQVDLTVADLSFISLRLVLPVLMACTRTGGDVLPMVKPQFEVGRERLGSGGVVRDPQMRAEVVLAIAREAATMGWGTRGVIRSPLPGPSGNVEFFLWLSRGGPDPDPDQIAAVAEET